MEIDDDLGIKQKYQDQQLVTQKTNLVNLGRINKILETL